MTRRARWRPKVITQRESRLAFDVQAPKESRLVSVCRCGHEWQGGEKRCPDCGAWAVQPAPRETQLTDKDRAELDQFAPTKPSPPKVSPPAPSESQSHQALREWIDTQWWRKGVMRPESQASRGWKEQGQLKTEGGDYTVGIPDWMGGVPARDMPSPVWSDRTYRATPILWALELKAQDAIAESTKAKLEPEWWLTDRWPWQIRGEVWNDNGLHNALTWAQARMLRSLDTLGYRTMVAYGHDEAIEWLDKLCGPRPVVEPDWGW